MIPGTVYFKTLRDMRRSLTGWAVGIVALVGMMVALWPAIRDMDFSFVEQYPEALQELFNLDAISTGPGFLNAELFSSLLPILFITFGVGKGAALLAREEDSGTMDVLLSTPLSRNRMLAEKAAAATTGVIGLGAVLFAATWLLAGIANMGVGAGYIAGASLAVVLLGLLFGSIAFAITAVVGKRAVAIGVSVALAVAGYVLYIAAGFVDWIRDLEWLTPFHHAIGVGPAADGTAGLPLGFLWLLVAAVLLVGATRPVFDRRDLGV